MICEQQQINDVGACALHPAIQLHHQRKNGEWRILLTSCPLCTILSATTTTTTTIKTENHCAASITASSVVKEEEDILASASDLHECHEVREDSQKHGGNPSSVIFDGDKENNIRDDDGEKQQQLQLGSDENNSPTVVLSDLDRKIQEKLKLKQALKKQKNNSKGLGSNRTGSRQLDNYNIVPPCARPRSPSPQPSSPRQPSAQCCEKKDEEEGEEQVINNTMMMLVTPPLQQPAQAHDMLPNITQQQAEQKDDDQLLESNDDDEIISQNLHATFHEFLCKDASKLGLTEKTSPRLKKVISTANNDDDDNGNTQNHQMKNNATPPPPPRRPVTTPSPIKQLQHQQQGRIQGNTSTVQTQSHFHSPPPIYKQEQDTSYTNNKGKEQLHPPPPPPRTPPQCAAINSTDIPHIKRPDPEDTNEYNLSQDDIIQQQRHHFHLQQQQQQHCSPSAPPHRTYHSSDHSLVANDQQQYHRHGDVYHNNQNQNAQYQNRIQQQQHFHNQMQSYHPNTQQQKQEQHLNVLEQDEISLMSMSSVIQQHLNQKQQQQQQKQRYRLEKVDDDDEESDSDASLSSSSSDSQQNEYIRRRSTDYSIGSSNNTSTYNDKGFCNRHPTVRLRKKKTIFSKELDQVVLSTCPECCLDEMKRVKEDVYFNNYKCRRKIKKKKKNRQRLSGSCNSCNNGRTDNSQMSKASHDGGEFDYHRRSSEKKKSRRKKNRKELEPPPITQLSLHSSWSSSGGGEGDDGSRSNGTATTASYTHSTAATGSPTQLAGGRHNHVMPQPPPRNLQHLDAYDNNNKTMMSQYSSLSWPPQQIPNKMGVTLSPPEKKQLRQSYLTTLNEVDDSSQASLGQQQQEAEHRAVVCGMHWTDDDENYGVYTGEVNDDNIPNGMGSMRYSDTGDITEGIWKEGKIVMHSNNNDDSCDSASSSPSSCDGDGGFG